MTFAHGVEARYPFLDRELVEFIRTIPVPLQLQGFDEKALLKRIARRVVPSQIVEREKFGFAAPGSPLLLRQNCEFINDILSPAQITKDGYFDPAAVESLRRQYEAPGFRINVPFEIDLLAVVLTFGIFRELFDLPQLN
jgi:asparagine synthase (glutamine-hydrolysing)